MKDFLQFLDRAIKGKYPEYALNIPTATIQEHLGPALEDFAKIKFWLAGYYQTLRLVNSTKGLSLSKEALADFVAVRAFLSQFDPKGGVATIGGAK